jgi:hypothetical protein
MKGKGYFDRSHEHSLNSRGITTVNKKPIYSKKAPKDMSHAELTKEVKKVFDETIYEFIKQNKDADENTKKFVTSYNEYLKYKKEHGDHEKTKIYGEEFDTGAISVFGVKPEWTESQIKEHFKKVKSEWPAYKDDSKKILADLQVYTDKIMDSRKDIMCGYNGGWVSGLFPKPKDSPVLLTLVYDGSPYDYFSYEAEYGGGTITKQLEKNLKKRFDNAVLLEHYNSYSCYIADTR